LAQRRGITHLAKLKLHKKSDNFAIVSDMPDANEQARRGRPVTTNPIQVGLTALRLFQERGIDNVTMDEVALEAGISRSNLFRVFPSKSAIIWGSMHKFTQDLSENLKSDSETSMITHLHNSWTRTLEDVGDERMETMRLRLRLIASSPEVSGWGYAQLEEARAVIEKEILRLDDSNPMRAKVVSSAMISASMAILTWWAQNDDPRSPSQVLDEGLSDFEAVFN
jgi:AcrR family transcriptional regulator